MSNSNSNKFKYKMEHTVKEVAKKLNVKDETIRRYIKNGELKAIKKSKGKRYTYIITDAELSSFLAKNA
jgi:excisionase family DNA binding protein